MHISRTLIFGTFPLQRLAQRDPHVPEVRPPWNFQTIRPRDGTWPSLNKSTAVPRWSWAQTATSLY